jgi:hypothetical protein
MEEVELSDDYSMVRLPLGNNGGYALECKRCGSLVSNPNTHDTFHSELTRS